MRVAKYYNNDDVRIEEMPVPKIGDEDLLVKVIASGICGSDVMEWYRIKKAPLVLGHEITGNIVEVGAGVSGYKVGDRVFVSHHVPCNNCHYCDFDNHTACETLHTTNYDPGGFAEYLRIPKINVERGTFLLPKEISYEEGVFIEPLACVVRGQRKADFKAGQSVLILGSGLAGLLHMMLAKANGAERVVVTDVNEARLKLAKELGADAVIKATEDIPSNFRKINDGLLADQVVICTGAKSVFEQALGSVDRGGTVMFFAPTEPGVNLEIPVNDFWRNAVKLMPSYGAGPDDIKSAIGIIAEKKIGVEKLITHRLKLDEAGKGFKLVADAKECMKVILLPHPNDAKSV